MKCKLCLSVTMVTMILLDFLQIFITDLSPQFLKCLFMQTIRPFLKEMVNLCLWNFCFFSTIHADVYQYISISFLQNCKFFFVRILNSATLQFCIKSIEHKIPGYELSLYYLIFKKKSMIFISRKNSSNFLRNPIFLTKIL